METTTRQFIIGMIVFSALVTGCFTLISLSIPPNIDSDKFSQANETLNKFSEINSNANDITDTIKTTPSSSGPLGIINDLVEITITGLKSVWTSFSTFKIIVSSFAAGVGLPIPAWFSLMLIAIVGIIIAFSLAAAYFKWWL